VSDPITAVAYNLRRTKFWKLGGERPELNVFCDGKETDSLDRLGMLHQFGTKPSEVADFKGLNGRNESFKYNISVVISFTLPMTYLTIRSANRLTR
jgi:hypothetical protein